MADSIPPGASNGLQFPDAELVFGLVFAVGTDSSGVELTLANYIRRFNYEPRVVSLSEYIATIADRVQLDVKLCEHPEADRINSFMDAGNKLRELTGSRDFVAAAAIADISRMRRICDGNRLPLPKTVHILRSLKRPEEVEILRKIYGPGFFLIGIFASESERLNYLTRDKNVARRDSRKLMVRDEDEAMEYGQRTRNTFQLADVFVRLKNEAYKNQLERFLDLVFGFPYHTPEPDEQAMFLAYSAGLRSGSLARQVGASIRGASGDIIAVGCNDVPCAGGGLYWPGTGDQRDHVKRYDSNDIQLQRIARDVARRLHLSTDLRSVKTLDVLKGSLLLDVTEYGRAVHAEMEALISCAGNGVSPKNGELSTTTFPCHNCTRHIIAAGIRRVVYIEPYPKSLAAELHEDAISIGEPMRGTRSATGEIPFEAFVGVGPRRFFDLFSMKLSQGYEVHRKRDGRVIRWNRSDAIPRVQMLPSSYLQREQLTADNVKIKLDELKNQPRLL
jgi:deoxycytidylate deaminase